jgi:Tol biopolymer transport system component
MDQHTTTRGSCRPSSTAARPPAGSSPPVPGSAVDGMHHRTAAFPVAPSRTGWRAVAVVLALLLAAGACTNDRGTPSPATTSPSPAGNLPGLIAYSTGDGDIWVMGADGSNRRRVTRTRDPDLDFDPSLSPDGRRVVFRTTRGHYAPDPTGTGVQGIMVADVAGSREREIQPPRGGLFPDWSPDGHRIALSTLRADGTETILTMHPDGTHVHDTGVVGGECAEWSPDSTRIAYCHHGGDGDFDVWVMNADGRHQQRLTSGGGRDYPGAWSPDGRRLAFGSQRDGSFDVWVMNADGSGQQQLTHAPDGESPVAWLPDGRIVYASFHGEEPLPRWYLMNPDGTGERSLPQLQGAGDPIDWLATTG